MSPDYDMISSSRRTIPCDFFVSQREAHRRQRVCKEYSSYQHNKVVTGRKKLFLQQMGKE